MKRYGITYATKHMRTVWQDWDYFHCHAESEQAAIQRLLDTQLPDVNVQYCIANVVEWKGEPNGQYILTAA